MEEDHLTPGQLATLAEIRSRRGALVKVHRMKKAVANNQAVLPRRADAGRTATTRNMKARAAGRRGVGRCAGVWQNAYAAGSVHASLWAQDISVQQLQKNVARFPG